MDNWPHTPYGPPPGWYADPRDRSQLRWWDGNDWSRETRIRPHEQPFARRLPAEDGREIGVNWSNGQSGRSTLQSRPLSATRPPSLYADQPDTRINHPLRYAEGNHRRGERRDLGVEVATQSAFAKTKVTDSARSEDSLTTDEMRRSGLIRLTLSAIFGLSVVLYAACFALDNDVFRLVALVGILFFGVGTAPLQLSERASLDLRLCVAGVVGLSIPLLVGAVMVLVPLWQPVLAAIPFGVAAIWVHVQASRKVLSGPLGTEIFRPVQFKIKDLLDASAVCSLVGTLLWLAGVATIGHVVNPGVFGFLTKAPVYWYLGLILLIAGIVQARGDSEWRSAFGVISLLAALTLTPAVVYGMPRSASAAKHIDFVQSILQMHSLSPSVGIFRSYSGLFDGVAWLCNLSAMHNVTGIATYFPFFIDLVYLAGLRFFLGRLTVSRYRIWIIVLLSTLANSIGADYFSPQAVGFAMAVCIFGLALDKQDFPGLGETERAGLLLLAGCAMAITHELSPFVAGGALIVLLIFRGIRSRYVPVLIMMPAIIWAFLHRSEVSQFASLSDALNLANFETPRQAAIVSTPGLQRLPVVAESSDALALGLVVLIVIAVFGLVRTARARTAWALMINPAVGLILTAANPYGGEGIYRSALFGIPWLAAIGTQAIPKAYLAKYSAVFGAIGSCLLGTFLVAMFGLDNLNVIRPADFKVIQIYEATAPSYSYLLNLSDGINLPETDGFPSEGNHVVLWGSIITGAQGAITHPTNKDVDAVAKQYYQYASNNDGETGALYAVWSLASVEYAIDYGHETYAQAIAWRNAIIASPDWKVVYSDDGSYLFRLNSNVSVKS